MKPSFQIVKDFLEHKDNMCVSIKNPYFETIINSIIVSEAHRGYVAIVDIEISNLVKEIIKMTKDELIVFRKGKILKINHEHNINGKILKSVLNNVFRNPFAIIHDESITKNHNYPTYNFVSKVTRDNKPFYAVVEVKTKTNDRTIDNVIVIKTVFDKRQINQFIERIRKKEKAGLSLLYLE